MNNSLSKIETEEASVNETLILYEKLHQLYDNDHEESNLYIEKLKQSTHALETGTLEIQKIRDIQKIERLSLELDKIILEQEKAQLERQKAELENDKEIADLERRINSLLFMWN